MTALPSSCAPVRYPNRPNQVLGVERQTLAGNVDRARAPQRDKELLLAGLVVRPGGIDGRQLPHVGAERSDIQAGVVSSGRTACECSVLGRPGRRLRVARVVLRPRSELPRRLLAVGEVDAGAGVRLAALVAASGEAVACVRETTWRDRFLVSDEDLGHWRGMDGRPRPGRGLRLEVGEWVQERLRERWERLDHVEQQG